MMDLDEPMIREFRAVTRLWTKMYFCGMCSAESYAPIWRNWEEYWKKRGKEPPLL